MFDIFAQVSLGNVKKNIQAELAYYNYDQVLILEATYGPKNVVEDVKRLYKEGRRKFKATNTDYGDPAPGVTKKLIIKWSYNGQTKIETV